MSKIGSEEDTKSEMGRTRNDVREVSGEMKMHEREAGLLGVHFSDSICVPNIHFIYLLIYFQGEGYHSLLTFTKKAKVINFQLMQISIIRLKNSK